MMTWIGIDPGLSGGICVLRDSVPELHVMPTLPSPKGTGREYDVQVIRELLMSHGEPTRVAIERQQAMVLQGRTQGVTSTFRTGYGFGLLVGICAGHGMPYSIVHPRTWQAWAFAGMPRGDTKAASAIVAQRMFPGVNLLATERCRKYHDGMSDALLIAAYAAKEL